MTKRLVAITAMLLFVIVPIGASTQATTLDARHRPGRGIVPPGAPAALQTVSGSLTNMTDSALTVTAGGVAYTVNISPTTKIVRRYGAPSDLDEMAPGDLLVVRGSQPVSNTISATHDPGSINPAGVDAHVRNAAVGQRHHRAGHGDCNGGQ